MAKKKVAVLHVQCAFMSGGAEALTKSLTARLRERGFNAEIISLPFKWYPLNTLRDHFLMWRMLDVTQTCGEPIDLVIALKAPTYLVKHSNKVLWLMHQHRVAYDLRDHVPAGGLNTIPGGDKVMKEIIAMDNMAIPEARDIYSISKNVTHRLKQYNHIDSTPLYHPPALVGRYQSGPFGDYILSVGRLDPNKRIDLMIRALPYCDQHITLKIAGRGREAEPLQALARELHVEDRVELMGFVPDDDVIQLYAGALGVCFPPMDEDYGYITLESFLSKKPIVTCHDSGGVLEFARDQESAFVVDPAPEQIGACFQRLYENKTLARRMGEAGFETVKDVSWDHVIDELTKSIR